MDYCDYGPLGLLYSKINQLINIFKMISTESDKGTISKRIVLEQLIPLV